MRFTKLSLVFVFLFLLGRKEAIAQDNCIAIAINEYCASNIPGSGLTDAYGELSDWVELKCNFTSSVSLSGYYLSNDKNNLYKWKFPSSFKMGPGTYALVWLSGRNTVKTNSLGQPEYHASFTLEQCRNQWLILSSSTGVIRDSVFVRSAMGGHVWGRKPDDCFNTGATAFKLYLPNAQSPGAPNGNIYYNGYAPTPQLYDAKETNFTGKYNKGGFYSDQSNAIFYFKMNGRTYDTASTCFDIFYTEDGSVPVPAWPVPVPPTFRYIDSLTPIAVAKTEVIRFIAVESPEGGCPTNTGILPSFIETNTYFVDPSHQQFTPEFGVVSVTLNDQNWLHPTLGGVGSTSVHVEYYDNKQQVSEGYAQIDKPFFEAWVNAQRGFNISIDDRFGFGCNFEGPVFNVEGLGTSTRTLFPTLHLKGGDFESHSEFLFAATAGTSSGTSIRDVFIQSLAAKYDLHVNPLHVKPVIGFINGEYSGVYDLREVYDKYYENYYNGQPLDSVDLNYVHGTEGSVKYWDGSISSTPSNNFKSEVYDIVMNNPMNGTNNTKYKQVMDKLDKASFIDYMILNSYTQNQDMFKWNVAFGRGHDKTKNGYKWHYYLLNMPSTFNFTAYANPGVSPYINPGASPCYIHQPPLTAIQSGAYNGHGNMLIMLTGNYPQKTSWGNQQFILEYRNRYQDLMNGPLKCENIMKHYEYVVSLYKKEMYCHEDPACEQTADFPTTVGLWDTNTTHLRRNIGNRCYAIENQFSKGNCYGLQGPYDLTVDVRPAGAGKVKLNTTMLDNFVWRGKYYQTTMSFKAIATSTDYAFHHWEVKGPLSKDPISQDSIGLNFNIAGDVVAVFTDKRNELIAEGENANIPTGFTPNGDGLNDDFRPLGPSEYTSEYQMTIWNRWGQEVFRSTDPLVGWDGRYRGSEAPTGVYAYVITYKNIYNEAKMAKGNVTLTR